MKLPFVRTPLAVAVGGCALAVAAGQAQGAAFALAEQSASGMGTAFAGGAAEAADASTVWMNPAGMVRLPMQLVAALHVVTPSIEFNNDGSIAALNQPLGDSGGNAGSHNYLPNFYFTVPVTRELYFGLGVNPPFGLVTWYGSGFVGRYQAIESTLKTINVEPALAWKFNDQWSLGVGVNWQRIDATLTQATNYSGALIQGATALAAAGQIPQTLVPQIAAATPGLDGYGSINGRDSAWGWNIGVLFNRNDRQRVGAQYRSSMKYDVVGSASFSHPVPPVPGTVPPTLAPIVGQIANLVNASPTFADGGVTLAVELPPSANLSYFGALDDRWDVMADAKWTGWSTIPELKVVRTNGAVLTDQKWDYKDSWRLSAGVNYHHSDQWLLRGGIAWDQTPTNDTDRSPRLPDSDRVWLSAGAQYVWDKHWKFDFGFTYIFAQSPPIDHYPDPTPASVAAYGQLKGTYDASVTMVSGQVTYSF